MTDIGFSYPLNIRFGCRKCGLCCGDTPQKTRHILLTQHDAERVAEASGEPISKFADPTIAKYPYIYEMHKDRESGKCVFLKDSRCTVYLDRPLICRFYPFELTSGADGAYVFRETDECPSIRTQSSKAKRLDTDFFRALLALAEVEFNKS